MKQQVVQKQGCLERRVSRKGKNRKAKALCCPPESITALLILQYKIRSFKKNYLNFYPRKLKKEEQIKSKVSIRK